MKDKRGFGYNNILAWIDIETGGLSKHENPILSLGIIITKNMEEISREEFRFKPLVGIEKISSKALEVNGFTLDQVKGFPEFKDEIKRLSEFLDENLKICENQKNKFFIGSKNGISFDIPFLKFWLQKRNGFDLCQYFHEENHVDVDRISREFDKRLFAKGSRPENKKLSTLADFYSIDSSGAHAALFDVEMTIKIYLRFSAGYIDSAEQPQLFK